MTADAEGGPSVVSIPRPSSGQGPVSQAWRHSLTQMGLGFHCPWRLGPFMPLLTARP